jgi:hypothetical protein
MYLNALEFLEEEREAWAPYEQLADLTDEGLESTPAGEAAHGWTGRDLAGHMVAWQEHALAVARELAVDQQSATRERGSADWDQRGGDVVNAELIERWRALPLDEVRRRLREVPGELRGTLTVVPETRWLKDAAMLRFFEEETIEHYQEHRPELEAILGAAGR